MPYNRSVLNFHSNLLSVDRRHFLESAFPAREQNFKQAIYLANVNQWGLNHYFKSITDCAGFSEETKTAMLPICVEALLCKIISIQKQTGMSDSSGFKVSGKGREILYYLNAHLTESITLEQIAGQFFISKHHLNKEFKESTGTTVMDYLIHKRVIYAHQLLLDGHSAQDASVRSGFHDYSVFYRAYQKYLGHSPVKDRGAVPTFLTGDGAADFRTSHG